MTGDTGLPPGQYEIDEFPRFGLAHFAGRFPKETRQIQLMLTGDVEEATSVSNELRDLPRVDQTSDFHCVTTWPRRALHWSGFRFADFFEQIAVPRARPQRDATFVIEHGAPLRLVAPAHYGYKNAKHVCGVAFWRYQRRDRPAAFRFMDHARARVVLEERGRGVPGWMLRWLYRPLVGPTIRRFRRALDQHTGTQR